MAPFRMMILAALLIPVIGTTPACSKAPEPLSTDPDLIAFVTAVEPENGDGARVSLESHADKLVARYIVDVTDDTLVLRRDDERLLPADPASLELKHWVQVWFDGELSGSDPQEGTAAQLVILGFQSQ